MDYSFDASQIAELAMKVEESGALYYHDLSQKVTDEKLKAFFLELENQERGHERSFAQIRDEEKQKNDVGDYMVDLYSTMLNAVEEMKKAAFNLESTSGNIENLGQVIDLAINAEIQSIQLYTAMQEKFVSKFSKTLQAIIDQENYHLQSLKEVKGTLN